MRIAITFAPGPGGSDVMIGARYEIFKGSPSNPLWLESLDNLDTASLRMKECAETRPGPYFIYCCDSGRILETIDTSSESKHQTTD